MDIQNLTEMEDQQIQDYELVVIVSPAITEAALEAVVNKISQYITQNDGTVSKVDQWGKKGLAYPIKHFMEGNYMCVRFKMLPKACKQLEADLRISEEVLRHLLVKLSR
jgi:small subunit ribosomal protein S6